MAKKSLEPKIIGLFLLTAPGFLRALTNIPGNRVWAEPKERCWRQEEHRSSLGQYGSSQLTFVHRLEEQQCYRAGNSVACAFEIVSPLPGKNRAEADRAHEQSAYRLGTWNQEGSFWVSMRGCVAKVLLGRVMLSVSLMRSEETEAMMSELSILEG